MNLSKTLALVGIGVAVIGMFAILHDDKATQMVVLTPFAIIGAGSLIALAITETKGRD